MPVPKRYRAGQKKLSAAQLNNQQDQVQALAALQVTGAATFQREGGVYTLNVNTDEGGFWARIDGEGATGRYAYTEMDLQPDGSFTELAGGRSGTADGDPLLEVNRVTGVAAGTIVWAVPGVGEVEGSGVLQHWMFVAGSGGGGGPNWDLGIISGGSDYDVDGNPAAYTFRHLKTTTPGVYVPDLGLPEYTGFRAPTAAAVPGDYPPDLPAGQSILYRPVTLPGRTPGVAYTVGEDGLTVNFLSVPTGCVGAAVVGWDFGDGGTGTGSPVSHTYATGGTYTVTVTVDDSSGRDPDTFTFTADLSAPAGVAQTPVTDPAAGPDWQVFEITPWDGIECDTTIRSVFCKAGFLHVIVGTICARGLKQSAIPVTYNCETGGCVDPGDGSGDYTDLASCEAACGGG